MVSIIASIQAVIFYFALAAAIVFLLLIPLGLAHPKIFFGILGKNTSRLKLFVILLVAFLATAGLAIMTEPDDIRTSNNQMVETAKVGYYKVVKVIDGDTIKVEIKGKTETVRLIGIDAPETPKGCFAQEAKAKASKILAGEQVKLKADKSQKNRDIYGRLLRYVLLEDGTNLNRLLIAGGYAKEFTFKTGYSYQAKFKKSQKQAMKNHRGLWSPGVCDTKN
jgi:endonuclease YncB( thermonuclease family)